MRIRNKTFDNMIENQLRMLELLREYNDRIYKLELEIADMKEELQNSRRNQGL